MSGVTPHLLERDPAKFLEAVRASDEKEGFPRFPEHKFCYVGPIHLLVSLVGKHPRRSQSISNELGISILHALIECGCSLIERDLYYEQAPICSFRKQTDNEAFRAEFDRLLAIEQEGGKEAVATTVRDGAGSRPPARVGSDPRGAGGAA